MKILSLRLKSILITAAVLFAVTACVYFIASLVNETVSADEGLTTIYNINNKI